MSEQQPSQPTPPPARSGGPESWPARSVPRLLRLRPTALPATALSSIEPPSAVPPSAVPPSAVPPSAVPAQGAPAVVLPPFDAAALLERQLAEMDAPFDLSEAEIAALPLSSDEPPDLCEMPWWLTDQFYGSDAAEQASWLATLPADIRAAYEYGPWDGSGEVFAAGFLHHDSGSGPAGPGFASGGLC